jgi:hypothetical protein
MLSRRRRHCVSAPSPPVRLLPAALPDQVCAVIAGAGDRQRSRQDQVSISAPR